jgi:predicted CXXCH cytochrome family protein
VSVTEAEEKVLKIDTGASCITSSCHSDMGKKQSRHVVSLDGKRCIICHEVSESGKHIFKKYPAETRPLCAGCHSEEFKTPPGIDGSPSKVITAATPSNQHKPFAEGKCTTCHDAHESNYFKHLKAEYPTDFYAYYAAGAYSLCFNGACHEGLEEVFREPRTLTLTQFRNGNLNLHFRHVNKIKGRTCKACHHHHASENPRLIRDTFQFGNRELTLKFEMTETGGQCNATCHKIAKYDRYDPATNLIFTTPRTGKDATEEELRLSKEQDMGTETESDDIEEGKNAEEKNEEEKRKK